MVALTKLHHFLYKQIPFSQALLQFISRYLSHSYSFWALYPAFCNSRYVILIILHFFIINRFHFYRLCCRLYPDLEANVPFFWNLCVLLFMTMDLTAFITLHFRYRQISFSETYFSDIPLQKLLFRFLKLYTTFSLQLATLIHYISIITYFHLLQLFKINIL